MDNVTHNIIFTIIIVIIYSILFFFIGNDNAEKDIVKQCNNFGMFEVENVIYNCRVNDDE